MSVIGVVFGIVTGYGAAYIEPTPVEAPKLSKDKNLIFYGSIVARDLQNQTFTIESSSRTGLKTYRLQFVYDDSTDVYPYEVYSYNGIVHRMFLYAPKRISFESFIIGSYVGINRDPEYDTELRAKSIFVSN